MNNNKFLLNVIEDAVITVPGVSSFAIFDSSGESNHETLATTDINSAIEFIVDNNFAFFRIHVVLISDVNIKDIINEVQIRVKYELEKTSWLSTKYAVDVIVDDVLLNY